MLVTDLPMDIIVLLYPYLAAKDFLSFTSCTPPLLPYRKDASFWRALTRSTFRIPPQPLLETDGTHWFRLYRSLRDQTCVYTWGNDTGGNLGHMGPARHGFTPRRRPAGWPTRMQNLADVGIVTDVQCGGWSTVLLNDLGQIWAAGSLNGMTHQKPNSELTKLTFPPGWPETTRERYEPSTAIREFSIGRYRILGLADDNKIWEWQNFNHPGQVVFFFNLPNDRERRGDRNKKVAKVVAGWSMSSAYIRGRGIVYWSEQGSFDETSPTDSLITAHTGIPSTAYLRGDRSSQYESHIGEVMNYVFLEDYIVFITHESKVYCWNTATPFSSDDDSTRPVELTSFYTPGEKIVDIQGAFRKFGVFTKTGAVLLGEQGMLDRLWSAPSAPSASPTCPPALQHCGVLSLAFGDWHFHALHANGSITSYGHEPKSCGALGLGSRNVSYLRGVYQDVAQHGDGVLKVPAWSNGRRTVWFEEEKERWLSDTCQKAATAEARPRYLATQNDPGAVALMGEWFEREGSDWELGPGASSPATSDGPGPAFRALKVAAAGWSSAALVLVDADRAEAIRQKYLLPAPSQPASTSTSTAPDPAFPRAPASPPAELSWVDFTLQRVSRWTLGSADPPTSPGTENPTGAAPGAAAGPRPTGGSTSPATGGPVTLGSPTSPAPAGPVTAGQANGPGGQITLNSRVRPRPLGDRDVEPYIWDAHPFPRLRWPDGSGRVMDGEVAVMEWKGGEPVVG